MLTYILDVLLQFCSKVTTLSDLVVYLNCQGSATNKSSPVELQWNLNRAPVLIELQFSSGTTLNPLHVAQWVNYFNEKS